MRNDWPPGWQSGVELNKWKDAKMAFRITDKCTACGKCAESCPVEAISKSKDEKRYVIDEENALSAGYAPVNVRWKPLEK